MIESRHDRIGARADRGDENTEDNGGHRKNCIQSACHQQGPSETQQLDQYERRRQGADGGTQNVGKVQIAERSLRNGLRTLRPDHRHEQWKRGPHARAPGN